MPGTSPICSNRGGRTARRERSERLDIPNGEAVSTFAANEVSSQKSTPTRFEHGSRTPAQPSVSEVSRNVFHLFKSGADSMSQTVFHYRRVGHPTKYTRDVRSSFGNSSQLSPEPTAGTFASPFSIRTGPVDRLQPCFPAPERGAPRVSVREARGVFGSRRRSESLEVTSVVAPFGVEAGRSEEKKENTTNFLEMVETGASRLRSKDPFVSACPLYRGKPNRSRRR